MIFEKLLKFSLIFGAIFGISQQLDCTKIPETDQVAGKILKIPNNSADPVALSANFNCTYTIKPPKMVFSRITVTNQLKSVDDVITVTDGQGKITVIKNTSENSTDFYVFPETTTTVNVATKNTDANSKFLLTIDFLTLKNPRTVQLKTGQNLNYFSLNSVRNQPILVQHTDKISVTTARSGHKTDVFDNYFIVDGTLDSPKSIDRLVRFETGNFNASGGSVTLVGLDDSTSYSGVVLNPTAELAAHDKFAAVAVATRTGQVNVHAAGHLSAAVVFVAEGDSQLVLNSFTVKNADDSSTCKAMAVTGPPNSASRPLVDVMLAELPQLFPFDYFSLIVENCEASVQLQTALPANYFKKSGESDGFIFSPSYFNSAAPSTFNVTFEYTGTDPKQFVLDAESVSVNSNAQLDINIYDSKWQKTLSTVITGNQEGTRSRAFGTYLNVQMSGNGTARLRYQLTSSTFSAFSHLPAVLLLAILISLFST